MSNAEYVQALLALEPDEHQHAGDWVIYRGKPGTLHRFAAHVGVGSGEVELDEFLNVDELAGVMAAWDGVRGRLPASHRIASSDGAEEGR